MVDWLILLSNTYWCYSIDTNNYSLMQIGLLLPSKKWLLVYLLYICEQLTDSLNWS